MKLNAISKYGTLITCAVILIVGLISWFIKYPDTIPTRSKLTGTNAPKPIIAKRNSRLVLLLKNNNDEVIKGDLIAVLESTADFEEILKLETTLNELDTLISRRSKEKIKSIMHKPFNQLGELQIDYQSFIQVYINYRDYVLGDYVDKKKVFLKKDRDIANRSRYVLNEQRHLQQLDMGLTQTTIDKNKKLLNERIISEQEYRDLSSQYLNKQMSEPQMKSGYINNESQINSIEKELVELENQVLTYESQFEQALNQLKTQIEMWKQQYLIVASNSGKLVFSGFIQENQGIEAGKILGYVATNNPNIYMEALVPQLNLGKVALGQKVILKFDAYPWQEYGAVLGRIAYINPIPTDSGYYLAKVALPHSLMTNYKKEIPYVEGLVAKTEIITKDLRLAESLYYDLVKTIKK